MLKRYYYSVISLKYSFLLMALAMAIFALSFITITGRANLRIYVIITAVMLALILCRYYYLKLRISKQIKKIQNISEYENSSIEFENTFFLEERMLTYGKKGIIESDYHNVIKLQDKGKKNGTAVLSMQVDDETVNIRTVTALQAQFLAAFLQKKNPRIILEGIEPSGSGTFQSISTRSVK